jgi:zinc protease
MKKLATLLCVFLFAATQARALNLPVTERTLANGMQVVIIEDHRAPVVFHAVAYKVGGADEQPGKTGLAHFFEHLMFKGTTKYPNDTFDRLMDENGAERNAFTSQDMTFYYQRTNKDLLPLLMDIEADRMQNLVLTQQVLDTERKVVQEERRLRTDSDPFGTIFEKVNAKLYTKHPYGRPTVGWEEDVKALTIDDAISFYKAHYMPGNAILVVVGDVDTAATLQLIDKTYGALKNQGAIPTRNRPQEPQHTAPLRMDYRDTRLSYEMVSRSYLTPSVKGLTPKDYAANSIMAYILGGNSQSRLYQTLVARDKIASSSNLYFQAGAGDSGTLQIYAIPAPGIDLATIEKNADAVIADFIANGPTPDELANAINLEKAQKVYERDTPSSLAFTIGMLASGGIKSTYLDDVTTALDTLTAADIQNAAKRLLDINQSITLTAGPKS